MRVVLVPWPDSFEDWYHPLGVDRDRFLRDWRAEWTVGWARALVQDGHEVHLVHSTIGEAAMAVQEPSGMHVHFVLASPAYRLLRRAVWGHRWWARTQPLWRAAPAAAALWPPLFLHVLRLRPDVVVVQDYETPRWDIAAPVLRLIGLRLIGLDTGGSARPSRGPWKTWTRSLAHVLVAVNEDERRRLQQAGHVQAVCTPMPVDTAVFSPRDRYEARRELGLADDQALVVTAARLHPVKDLPLLAHACHAAGALLVIAGEGEQRAELESLGPATPLLLGELPPAELATWFAAADVVGLSSLSEGKPQVVLEALAAGRAVVSTDVGGVREHVHDDVGGWVVSPRDADGFAAALREALVDRTATDLRARRARAGVLAAHEPSSAAAALVGVLEGG